MGKHINQKLNRRKFLQSGATLAAGFFIMPRHVLGKGFIAPSDTLYIAGIGAGGKGTSDLTGFAASKHAKIVAFADVDKEMAAKSIENFPKANFYFDYREMLSKEKGIDAVSVSTPDHTHAVATMAAMELGKHVYVQKPLTYSIHEARMLTEAARKYKVVTQMGNQHASDEPVRMMKEWIDAGLIGEVKRVQAWTNRPVWPQGIPSPSGKHTVPDHLKWDLWLGPAAWAEYNPAYHPFNWRGWWAYGTGALGDMACHILDPVFKCLPIDYPSEVECSTTTVWEGFFKEGHYPESCPASSIIHLKLPRNDGKGDIKLTWMDGGLLPERPDELLPDEQMGDWNGGLIFEGTKGKMMGNYMTKPVLLPTKRMEEVTLPKQTLPRVPEGHYVQWVNACMKGYGKAEVSSPFDYAGPFTEAILMGNLALRSYQMKMQNAQGRDYFPGRKKLLWDAKNMRITNFEEANQFVKREYRQGWKL
ncbi:MAG TPA: Gfo/Idh/MocA family oxidoreductase [Cyclobacteriaceae bacterium]|nr:Gfo/Idh/MocA family oxidoreductase [Cyclobacteriaceae bacterium]